MKITTYRERSKEITFNNVPKGTVFDYQGKYFFSIERPLGYQHNAVDLENGELFAFESDDLILLVDAEMIIRD